MNDILIPWDGFEPITDALERRGLKEIFELAIEQGKADEASLLLRQVGADKETADGIIAIVLSHKIRTADSSLPASSAGNS